ncbi:MAG: hypothetical protein J7497_03725 [Chitinophagaceae bacterium]|nr:hypothetical protein [Chitinophagaceae bacterium]
MLLLKRISGFIIDLVLFYAFTIGLDFVLKRADIEVPARHLVPFGFFCALLLPILCLGKPPGHLIFRIRPKGDGRLYVRISLLLKYIFYYLIFSSGELSIFSVFTNILSYYTYITIPASFLFRISFVIMFVSILHFVVSLGRQNLFDALLNIRYPAKKGLHIHRLGTAYLFLLGLLTSSVIEFKVLEKINFSKFISEINSSVNQGYFPPEVFDSYTSSRGILVSYQYTNKILTPSDASSFVLNRNLLQRQIVAIVNDNVFKDGSKRKLFCMLLVYYSYLNPFNDNLYDVMQTRITLLNVKARSPFFDVQSAYTYYFDDKQPVHGVYGGYQPDTLYNFYQKTQERYYNAYVSSLSRTFSIPRDSIIKYLDDEGQLVLPETFEAHAKDTMMIMDTKEYLPKVPTFPVVPFDSVQPIEYLSMNLLGVHSGEVSLSNIDQMFIDQKTEDMFYVKLHYVFSR